MLRTKADYRFLTANALARIAIEGKPYPLRSQKLVLLGEDEAFLREAGCERNWISSGVPLGVDQAILKVARYLGDDAWNLGDFPGALWGALSMGYIDKDRMLAFNPDGEVASCVLDFLKPNGADLVYDLNVDYTYAVAGYETTRDNAWKSAYDALQAAVDGAERTRDGAIDAAESARDAAEDAADAKRSSDISAEYARYAQEQNSIVEEYKDDPKEMERRLLAASDGHGLNMSRIRQTFNRETREAGSGYGGAVWSAWAAYAAAVDEAWTAYVSACATAATQYAASVAAEWEDTSEAMEAVLENYYAENYLDTPGLYGYGWTFSPAVKAVQEAHDNTLLKESDVRLGAYLRSKPLCIILFDSRHKTASRECVALTCSSDATQSAFHDYNKMVAITRRETKPTVYRDATVLTRTWGGGTGSGGSETTNIPETSMNGTVTNASLLFRKDRQKRDSYDDESYSDYSWASNGFSVYLSGGRYEEASRIFATVRIGVRDDTESWHYDADDRRVNDQDKSARVVYLRRVELSKVGEVAGRGVRWSFSLSTAGMETDRIAITGSNYNKYQYAYFIDVMYLDVTYAVKSVTTDA